jgi:predicted Zn-dependent protease
MRSSPLASVEPAPVLHVLHESIALAMAHLQSQPDPPYFLAYQVIGEQQLSISAQNGALLASSESSARTLDIDLRLGSRSRDNTHPLPGSEGGSTFRGLNLLPLEEADASLRRAIWNATNLEYERSREDLMHVRSSVQLQESDAQKSPDLSKEEAVRFHEPSLETVVDKALWEGRLKRVSQLALSYPSIMTSSVSLDVSTETRYLANSEQSSVQVSGRQVRLWLSAESVAQDGLPVSRFASIDVRSIDALPNESVLFARFEQVLRDTLALLQAPVVEPYVGPAILDGLAAGVFFHEVLGHRIEGHRQDAKSEGQTFASRIGQPIMQARLNIYDDPSLYSVNGIQLNGFYRFDDQGVAAQRAELVQDGILRGFLQSRRPTRGFPHSNGHGRRQAAHGVVARQANLVVEPIEPLSREALKQALLEEVGRQGLRYGLRFTEISGGFTQTQRYDTQAFKVMPTMVYRVYLDGREELVRGVDIEGTPLTALSKIVAAGDDFEVFNGTCGAESGWVPVSATSPSILVSQIEVARQEALDERPPLLPPPSPSPMGRE